MTAGTADRGPILKVEGLTRRFGGLLAVSDFSFELQRGEILGLIGPNGAGKSTTFNVITGFYRPTAGTIELDGRRLDRIKPEQAARIGMIRTFQHESYLSEMTVRDNIAIGLDQFIKGARERDERIADVSERLGLTGVLNEKARNLPHGMQRKLGIAIACASRPRLLCLDEPLTGLNQVEVNETLGVIKALRAEFGTSVLFVEHNMRAVMSLCERIVMLDAGRKLAEGTPQEVSQNPDVIKAYLGEAA